MKLHSPAFERRLKRLVKRTIRSTPVLKREFKRVGKDQTGPLPQWLLLTVSPLLMVAFSLTYLASTASAPDAMLAFANLWILNWACTRAVALQTVLNGSLQDPALWLLPASTVTVFRYYLGRFWRGSLIGFIHVLVPLVVIATHLGVAGSQWLGVLTVTTSLWVLGITGALFGVAHWPGRSFRTLPFLSSMLMFALFFTERRFTEKVVHSFAQVAPTLNLLLPTGWLLAVLTRGGVWPIVGPLLLMTACIPVMRASIARLAKGYRYEESLLPPAVDLVPIEGAGRAFPIRADAQDSPPTAVAEHFVRSRAFFEPVPWQEKGLFERALWDWLSERERVLAEFVYPGGFDPWAFWKTLVRIVPIVAGVYLVASFIGAGNVVFTISAFMLGSLLLGSVFQTGQAFTKISLNGSLIPHYAFLGIGYRELGHLLIKSSVVQLPALATTLTLAGALGANLFHVAPTVGAVFGAKAALALVGARPAQVIVSFSACITGSQRLPHSILRLLGLFAFLATLGPLNGFALFVQTPMAFVALALAAGCAYMAFLGYGWVYHHTRFDLVQEPPRVR